MKCLPPVKHQQLNHTATQDMKFSLPPTESRFTFTVRVFVNQLYQPAVVEEINKNPDLQAIRIASVNPILDPWLYILLRKAVLLKLIEKIKCLFCRIGGRRQRPVIMKAQIVYNFFSMRRFH
ncbi:UNVERIFIED_CONTAM: hypothetical protein FKN15_034125 [Acipenser sinensis]